MATAAQQRGQAGSEKQDDQAGKARGAPGGDGRTRPMLGRLSHQERAEHNRVRLQDPQSVLLLPRTPEGRVVVGMLFALDKAVNRIRLSAGHSLSVGEVQRQLERVQGWVKEGQDLLKDLGVSEHDFGSPPMLTYQYRLNLAGQRNARVITPRSEETKKVSRVAEKLDAVILHTRMSCDDFARAEHVFARVHGLIKRLHELIADFCAQVGLPYRTPREAEELFRERRGQTSEVRAAAERDGPPRGRTPAV